VSSKITATIIKKKHNGEICPGKFRRTLTVHSNSLGIHKSFGIDSTGLKPETEIPVLLYNELQQIRQKGKVCRCYARIELSCQFFFMNYARLDLAASS
jgi:hypothetical protein